MKQRKRSLDELRLGNKRSENLPFLNRGLNFPLQGRGLGIQSEHAQACRAVVSLYAEQRDAEWCDKTLNQNTTGMAQFPAPDGLCREKGTGGAFFERYSLERVQQKSALTLTELLIAIGIIAVIAAFTLPTFIHNHQEKVNQARYENIVAKMTQAVSMMKANGDLDQFDTTMDFVNVLKKYLKINKICEADKIAECWGSNIVHTTDGKDFDVSEARTRANLGLVDDYGSNPNVGLVLSDGTHMIVSYDPSHQGLTMGDEVVTDENSDVSNLMKGLSFVTDVNGSRGPNKERIGNVQHDVRGFNGATFSEACLDGFYEGNSCKAASLCSGFIDGDKVCNEDKNACSGYIDTTTKACITNPDKVAECAYIDVEKTCHDSCDGTLYNNNTACCRTDAGSYIGSDGNSCVANCPSNETISGTTCQACNGTPYNNQSACCTTGSYVNSSMTDCLETCPQGSYIKGNSCVSQENCPGGSIIGNKCRPIYEGNQTSCINMGGAYMSNKCYVNIGTGYIALGKIAWDENAQMDDYWGGAKKVCSELNMTLPDLNTLQSYCNSSPGRGALNISSGPYWSSTIYDADTRRAWRVYFDNCNYNCSGCWLNEWRSYKDNVLCVR